MALVLASIFNFALVLFIFWYFGRRPIASFLLDRSEIVATALKDAEEQSKSAGALLELWTKNWRASESHAKQQFEEAKAAVVRIRESTLASAHAEAERVRRETELVGKTEVSRIKKHLRQELVERSVRMARAYLEGNLTEKDKHKLVAEYVERVSDGPA